VSAWILPVAAAVFWGGLLGRPLIGDSVPVWIWLLAGFAALGFSAVLAPADREAPDPLSQAGLVMPHPEPKAVAAVTVGRRRAGPGPPAATLRGTQNRDTTLSSIE